MTETSEGDICRRVREALDRLDGTLEPAVMLLTGLSSEQLDDLGGFPACQQAAGTGS